MANSSSKEIESQYNLIKMLLNYKKKHAQAFKTIKKDILYMPLDLNKKLEKENIVLESEKERSKYSLNMISIL